jgi:hypothetical protein
MEVLLIFVNGRIALSKEPLFSAVLSFYRDASALVGHGLLIIEDSRSHSDTPHSVRLYCTSDQPNAEAST